MGVARRVSLLVVAIAAALTLFPAVAGAVVPELLTSSPEDLHAGSGAAQMLFPRGIAADPNLPGRIYVADSGSNRIDVFTPWGVFVKAFGWRVNAEHPEEKLQTCTSATGCLKGSEGGGAGEFVRLEAIAVGPEGDVYVLEGERINVNVEFGFEHDIGNHRVQKFSPEGEFIYATGYDTIAHGPDDSTNNETQQLSVAASKGTFKLKFENPLTGGGTQETSALPFNASAVEVKAALNALATIGGLGGSVSVTGGPGDPTGSTPYTITFESNLGGDDVPQLSIDRTSLGAAAIGGTLRCATSREIEEESETIEYRWLRNGTLIVGAESPTYTTTAADEGKSIQCQVTAKSAQAAAMQAANPVYVAPPEGVTAPPVAPTGSEGPIAQTEFNSGFSVGGTGGGKIICEKGTWSGASSFAYSWYRNGVQIAGASEPTYVVTEKDLVTPAYFQCAVTASNVGTSTTTKFSNSNAGHRPVTVPGPSPSPPGGDKAVPTNMEPPSNVITAHRGGAVEVCKPADTCKAGIKGTGQGQFGASENASPGNLAVSPTDGTVYVGEGQHERIQIFHADGTFGEEITMPPKEEPSVPKDFTDLTVDSAGNLHVILVKPHGLTQPQQPVREIRELAPHGPSAEFFGPAIKREEELTRLAVDTAGNSYSKSSVRVVNIEKEDPERGVLEFDPAGECLDCGTEGEGGKPGFDRTSDRHDPKAIVGIAAGGACEATDIYILHTRVGQDVLDGADFSIFGPPPNTALCPPPAVPPRIGAQWANSVDSVGAELHAEINPEFWTDTRYYVEYGTSPCFEGGCAAKPLPPGSLLSHKTVKAPLKTVAIALEGLEPGTTYHYRFVAQSGGGGPVAGLSGKSGAAAEGTFATFARTTASPPCENDPFRIGPAALLPDCRAYEMVSPLDKESGDIKVLGEFTTGLPTVLEQSSTSGERLAYGAYRAFGDASSAPWTTQYVAARGEDGWRSHAISPPQLRQFAQVTKRLDTEFKLFSPDLCEAWLEGTGEPPLTEDAVPGAFNLYRRADEECGGPAYEALTTVPEPHSFSGLELQGVSADGQAEIYVVGDSLATVPPEPPGQPANCGNEGSGSDCLLQLYYRRPGGELHYVCVLPDGAALSGEAGCSAGTANDANDFYRTASLHHAISADGSKVFWTARPTGEGPLYLRENPSEAESAHLLGTAAGTGNLIGPATGTGKLINGSVNISNVKETKGHFAVGQAISGTGIKPETTILDRTEPSPGVFKLKMSQAASAGGEGVEVKGEGSATVSGLTITSGAFAAGQKVSAANGSLPPATIIACTPSCGPSATSLTLSAKARETGTAVALSATSECTEADKGCTLAVSQEAESASNSSGSRFWTAAEDGSRAIFGTFVGGGSSDLYEFDTAEAKDHLIAHKLLGVAGASADARWLYFASEEALVDEPNAQGLSPIEGRPNLYLFHEGEYRFIATLASTDVNSAFAVTSAQPRFNTTHVSSDGLHVAFMSQATPTGYDNLDANNGSVASEVYLYDAVANEGEGKLLCASCNPSGARPAGAELVNGEHKTFGWVAAYLPNWENTLYTPRVLSEDGTRLFFTSSDALTPRDTNGVEDVYQWEAPGTGGCEEGAPGYSALNEGCVNLISSGQSPHASKFVDASPDGHDVFFTTLAGLLPQDYGLIDIYDARVQGGFPQPPVPPAACEGEACQGTPEAPNDPTPASESFEGAGNVREEPLARSPKPCAKGKVKRHGKCVAKHSKSHKRAKRNRRAAR
jgi:hypothetical protein